MNQGRVLHPRPAVPAITSTHSCSEVNMLQHIVSPGMHSDKPSPGKNSPKNGNQKKKTAFVSLFGTSTKSSVESHEKYIPTNPEEIMDNDKSVAVNCQPNRVSANGRTSAAFVTNSSGEPC